MVASCLKYRINYIQSQLRDATENAITNLHLYAISLSFVSLLTQSLQNICAMGAPSITFLSL